VGRFGDLGFRVAAVPPGRSGQEQDQRVEQAEPGAEAEAAKGGSPAASSRSGRRSAG